MLTPYAFGFEHSEELDQILSYMRHELGNPVSTLKITLELLIRNHHRMDSAKRIEFLQRALKAIDCQHDYLDAMKRYAKASIGCMRPVAFASFWQPYEALIRNELKGHGIRLRSDRIDRSVVIKADVDALRTVLDALVENSLTAAAGQAQPEIRFKWAETDDMFTIGVTDNGDGFPPDQASRAFLPFHSTKPGHAGVGLSIAHKLVQQMNGRLSISTPTRNGATVCVELQKADAG